MDLAQQAKIVDSIHDTLHDFVGQRLKVRANMGRSKIVERTQWALLMLSVVVNI